MGGKIIDLLCRCFSLTPQPTLFRQDTPLRGNQPGQKLTMGETQTAGGRLFMHQYYLSPAAVPPSVDRPLGENAVPGDRERDKKQRASIENIASLVHRFLFASTFYVRIWMFPRMGPKDDGGTHTILRSERLFPRRSTGLSGGTLPPRERESERQLSMSRCGCSPGWVPRTMGEHIDNN